MPGPETGAPQVKTEEMVAFVDDYVAHMPTLLKKLFPIGLMLLELGAIVLSGAFVPLSFIRDRARKERYVKRWQHAPIQLFRELIKGVKGLCLLAYYSDEHVMRYIGYEPEPYVKLVAAERLKRHGHDLR